MYCNYIDSNFYNYPMFNSGDRIVSIVYHPPEIVSGTQATIVSPHSGVLYAVQLPNGELHRWFADFELQPVEQNFSNYLRIGDLAMVMTEEGHHSMIKKGMIVKIIKIIPDAHFYDLKLENGMYHRWLAEFEITYPV